MRDFAAKGAHIIPAQRPGGSAAARSAVRCKHGLGVLAFITCGDCAVTLLAENDVRPGFGNPAQGHRWDLGTAPLAVLMIPRSLLECEAVVA